MSFVPYGSSDAIKLSVSIIKNVVAVPTRSGKTCSDRDALKFMMMCQARRLNPFEGDAFLIGYDGKNGPEFSLITAHQAFLKRAEIHPEFDGMKSGIIVLDDEDSGKTTEVEGDFHLPNQKIVGGWATVFFKNRSHPIHRRIRLERFNKGFAQWQVDPAGMICKCAEADALRSAFPTMLGGLYMREEVSLDVSGRKTDAEAIGKLVDVRNAPAIEESSSASQTSDEREESEAGLAPETAAATQKSSASPQSELARVLGLSGFGFDEFRRWCDQSGSLKDAESLGDWDEIPTADAQRLLRAVLGRTSSKVIMEQLAQIKGGAK
jgi:phage recombination protein Bet